MAEITDPRLLWMKFTLFLVVGLLGATVLLVQFPDWLVPLLLAVTIWAFCRAYYFAFYVIEHYVDPSYRFAGLTSFVRFAMSRGVRFNEDE